MVPLAAELPETADLPPADLRSYVRKRSAALGFYAGDYPEELGGSGMPFSAVVLLHHAAGRSGCVLAPYALACSDGPSPLLRHGTPEQVARYLLPLVRGEAVRCLALTEPHAGSDAFRLTTIARRDGDDWLISGHKTFVSNADRADFALVVTATDQGAGTTGGATAFVLPMDQPGLRIGQRYEGMSGEPLFELLLDRVRVSTDAVIGGEEGVGAAMALAVDSLARAPDRRRDVQRHRRVRAAPGRGVRQGARGVRGADRHLPACPGTAGAAGPRRRPASCSRWPAPACLKNGEPRRRRTRRSPS